MTTTEGRPQWKPSPENQRVLPILPEEIDNFERQVERFRAGEWDELEFMAFRLKQGVYGQRQPERQMVRVKVPYGGLTALQMEVLGRFAEEYAPLKKGHITTRENVQFHHVPLEKTPEILRMLADAGLSTREACGNTVRNVVGCAMAGVCKGEVFDITPYAAAFARYFLRHPLTQAMPRKIKTAFSGCDSDCAITPIHDIGLLARIKDGKKGFKMVMGGGLSIMPRIAPTLYEFVSVEDCIRVSEAALRIFNRSETERKNRMRARIKFLIDRIGIDEFRRQVEEELKGSWAKKPIDLDSLLYFDDEEHDAPPPPPSGEPAPVYVNGEGPPRFLEWKRTNVLAQRQEGYNVVYVTLRRGDIFAHQWKPLAEIARAYAGGRARLDQQQNLVFRWVRTESLFDVYSALDEIGLATAGQQTITDIVSCPGTDSCKLGITSSMGLNQALGAALSGRYTSDPLVNELHIKASGCPNSCGHHHLANIGFHGAVMRGPGGQVPAYEVFLGGSYDDGVRMGTRLKARVPAKRAPDALTRILDYYQAERKDGEKFNAFFDRVGKEPFEKMLATMKDDVGPLNRENIETYMDWERTVIYKLERGEGECAV